MPEDDDNPHKEQMQIDEQEDPEWDCIFSKKDHSAMETEHHVLDLPRGQTQKIKDASVRTMRQNAMRAMQTPRNKLRNGNQTREKRRGRNKANKNSLQNKKEGGETSEDRTENEGPQLEIDNPAALDKLLGQLQERGLRNRVYGMDTKNCPTKGQDDLDQTDQLKRTSSRAGRGKRMGCNTLADKHASARCTKRIAQQAQETKAKRRGRTRQNQRKPSNVNAEG